MRFIKDTQWVLADARSPLGIDDGLCGAYDAEPNINGAQNVKHGKCLSKDEDSAFEAIAGVRAKGYAN